VKFLLLLHGDAEAEAALSRDERMAIVEKHTAYSRMLRELGVYVSGEALDDPHALLPGQRSRGLGGSREQEQELHELHLRSVSR
jgi:hypothetical protein